jgi:hypothetical protein
VRAACERILSPFRGFWLAAGVLFVLDGVWQLIGLRFSVVPIMLIVIGVALLVSVMRKAA